MINQNPITIARAIIRIGDAAREVNEYSLLHALNEFGWGARDFTVRTGGGVALKSAITKL